MCSIAVLSEQPSQSSRDLDALISFIAHVAPSYPNAASDVPHVLCRLLERNCALLSRETRMVVVDALALLRKRAMLSSRKLLPLLFGCLSVPDKHVRARIKAFVISDVRYAARHSTDGSLHRFLQSFVHKMIEDQDAHPIAVRVSLEVTILLYEKRVWCTKRTVGVLASACLHKRSRISVTACRFFLMDVRFVS